MLNKYKVSYIITIINMAKEIFYIRRSFDYMHTSGHIDMADLREFFRLLHPKGIIPIHTDKPEAFAKLFGDEFPVTLLSDGECQSTLHYIA